MPITPDEMSNVNELPGFKNFIIEIDNKLSKGDYVYKNTSMIEGYLHHNEYYSIFFINVKYPIDMLNEIVKIYKMAGWFDVSYSYPGTTTEITFYKR